MSILTLKELGGRISQHLVHHKNLVKATTSLIRYKGLDWKNHIGTINHDITRKKVFENKLLEIIVITWPPFFSSGFHDHASNGCIYKTVQGRLLEIVYDKNQKLHNSVLKVGNVKFISNDIGSHSIYNLDNDYTVSIHVYSPPNHQTKWFK